MLWGGGWFGGQWGGGKELHVHSQEGGEVCRELEPAHGSKKCLQETVGPGLGPGCRRQRLRSRAPAAPAQGRADEAALLPMSWAAASLSIPTNHVNRQERGPVAQFN